MKTLSDLIAFNVANCQREMQYFGQEDFEAAQQTSGNLNDPVYRTARTDSVTFSRQGIDGALQRDRLDAIVAPSYSFASTLPAIAGYPNLSIPVGLTPEGKPAGLWMYGGFLQEPKLLALAYDLEQEIRPRSQPQQVGSVPPPPPDAGICSALAAGTPRAGIQFIGGQAQTTKHLGTGKPLMP
jgi:amidase